MMYMKNVAVSFVGVIVLSFSHIAMAFDHQHVHLTQILKQVVQASEDNKQTRVNYAKLNGMSERLQKYVDTLSSVQESEYEVWSEYQQLSFLINAYNAYTLILINNNYMRFKSEQVSSITQLGVEGVSPWDKAFILLLSDKVSLNQIENDMIRVWFSRPRIHAALVCAAVSCPPLRDEAFVDTALDDQLNDQMSKFLSDDNNNTVDMKTQQVALSSVFKWYRDDFENGDQDFSSLEDLIAEYQHDMADNEQQLKLIESEEYQIRFLDYDWRLNDIANF